VLAVKTDGTLWAWGYNNNGQLGLGDITNRSSPVQVGALSNWANVSAGQNDWSIAVKTDGTLWTWGNNVTGQLGDGTVVNKSSPIQIGALTAWLIPSAGYRHALVTKTNGTLWAWGENNYGQVGNNATSAQVLSPIQIGALTNWSIASAAVSFSLAVKTDGTLWSWGQNSVGQLGQNTVGAGTYKSSPTQVGSSTTWYSVSATYVSGLALG
jgi:alpha-tubulin suppressor-like RCC1 family protein